MSVYASTSGSSSPFGVASVPRSNSPAFPSPSFASFQHDPYASPNSNANPTTRSRTLLFFSYRDSIVRSPKRRRISSNRAHAAYGGEDGDDDNDNELLFNADADDEQARLIGGAGGHVSLDMDTKLPPKWVDISDQVSDILAGTQSKMSALERLHAKHVLPGFADRSAEEREIESLTTDITRDFRRCSSLIQSITPSTSGSSTFPPAKPSKHEQLAAQNVQRGLAAKVQTLSASFRKKQRVYMETLQGHAIKNQDLLVASGAVTLKGAEGMSDVDEDLQIAAHGQRQSTTLALQEEELAPAVDLQQRDREITEIARSIAQLAELFKDLSGLVIDQGTLLDSVEYNIEQTAVEMQEAVTELKIAEGYQRSTGRRKCILLLILIIFGLIIVLIFKPRRHSSSSTSTGATHVATSSSSDPAANIASAVASATNLDVASNLSPMPESASSQLPPLPILSIDLGSGSGFGPRPRKRAAPTGHDRSRKNVRENTIPDFSGRVLWGTTDDT